VPLAESFLFPPAAHAVRTIDQKPQPAQAEPLYSWQEENIRFSSFKRTMDRTGYVLRLYEDRGQDTVFDLKLSGFDKAFLSGMAEEKRGEIEIRNGVVRLHAAPHKVITLILE